MGPLASLKGVTPDLKYMEALLKEINSNGVSASCCRESNCYFQDCKTGAHQSMTQALLV